MTSIKNRLFALERRLMSLFPRWSSDDDGFLAALSVNPHKYQKTNPDGSIGYDWLRALSDLAPNVWADGDDSQIH